MEGKIIVIEGTDCSGKATQAELLKENLEQNGYKVFAFDFPHYQSPTGKIIGGPYLGKKSICEGWFPEGASEVDPIVSSMFFAIDRYYNFPLIEAKRKEGYIILLDRYTYSAMAHQGGKISESKKRNECYEWIEKLEFEMLKLPVPDIRIFLHMPLDAETILLRNRKEEWDQNEADEMHLKNAESSYLELAEKYHFRTIECAKEKKIKDLKDIKTKEEIANEVWDITKQELERIV